VEPASGRGELGLTPSGDLGADRRCDHRPEQLDRSHDLVVQDRADRELDQEPVMVDDLNSD